MTTDTANQIISKYESLVVLCTYNILLTNDICCGQVIECLHAMKRTPYYKQAFKRYLNDADKARKEYERTVNSVIGSDRSEFFANCNDKYTEEVNKHVDMLYWQFKQVLDDNGISHSAEIARFSTITAYPIPQRLQGSSLQGHCVITPASSLTKGLKSFGRKMHGSTGSRWNI